jgi:enoyl-CoA hydratase/carnithine racemase
MPSEFFQLEYLDGIQLVRLHSPDHTNRLTRACVLALTDLIQELALNPQPLILAGNQQFFSAGADLSEIATLTAPAAFEFSRMGQHLMNRIARFPAPLYAAIEGYCMGGGLDLALACRRRIASPHSIFGHRGAALGLVTGWGGTQRLPRLIGKAQALEVFVSAEKLHASKALAIGLVDALSSDPVALAMQEIKS